MNADLKSEEAVKKRPAAYAMVEKKSRLIKMDAVTQALAIFDARQAALEMLKTHPGCGVVEIYIIPQKRRKP